MKSGFLIIISSENARKHIVVNCHEVLNENERINIEKVLSPTVNIAQNFTEKTGHH